MTVRSLPDFSDSDYVKAGGSGDDGCVEVAIARHSPELVGLRDSKNPRSTVLLLGAVEWVAFARSALPGGNADG